jgi:CheY-like chemotaxis protein
MSLNKAIQSALDLVAYALRSGGISVKLSLDEDLPEITADFDQMVQVFVNLFVNAEHAMRDAEGQRVLSVATFPANGRKLAVAEVADSGMGIKPDILPRIFEPFFTTKAVGVGTGMGLAVSFGMIAAHGGMLEAIPPPDGRGAAFRVSLPVGGTKPAVLQKSSPSQASTLAKRRILVVDDEPEIVSLLAEIFERAGHEVEQAEDGAKALALAGNASYDAIFCDLRMPVMDGRTLRKKLGKSQPRYESRMAFITGDLLGTIKQGEKLDGCPVIEKPFHAETVLGILSKLTANPA